MALRMGVREGRSVLRSLSHHGPVRLQKLFWPEGPNPAHAILVHPPGAMAGGDRMDLHIHAEPGSGVVFTTPGAGKWYRARASASQHLHFQVDEGACVEWMPQETLVHDGARMHAETTWQLACGARAAASDILVFGRRQSGERCADLDLRLDSRILIGERLVYLDPLALQTGAGQPSIDRQLGGAAVMAGSHVSGVLWAYAPEFSSEGNFGAALTPLHDALEAILAALEGSASGMHCAEGELCAPFVRTESPHKEPARQPRASLAVGATRLPCGLVLVRVVGNDTELVRERLQQAWGLLRPLLRARAAIVPRIWKT